MALLRRQPTAFNPIYGDIWSKQSKATSLTTKELKQKLYKKNICREIRGTQLTIFAKLVMIVTSLRHTIPRLNPPSISTNILDSILIRRLRRTFCLVMSSNTCAAAIVKEIVEFATITKDAGYDGEQVDLIKQVYNEIELGLLKKYPLNSRNIVMASDLVRLSYPTPVSVRQKLKTEKIILQMLKKAMRVAVLAQPLAARGAMRWRYAWALCVVLYNFRTLIC